MRIQTWTRLGVLVGIAVLVGCDAPAPPAEHVPVQRSDAQEPGIQVLSLDPDWTVGRHEEIGELGDAAILPDGRIAVLDMMNAVVIVFDQDGGTAARIGRAGEGPGELSPRGLTGLVATDSSIVVPDIQLQRSNEFSPAGELLDVVRLSELSSSPEPLYGVDWRKHPGDGLVLRAITPAGHSILHLHGGRVDTLHAFDVPASPPNTLLAPTPVWDMDQDSRLVVGRSDRREVELLEAGGQETAWLARLQSGDRRGLTAEDLGHLEELVAASAEARGVPAASVAFPENAPVVARVMAAPEGRYWVQRARPVAEMGIAALRVGRAQGFGGPVWDVLSGDGRLAEVVRLPEGFSPVEFADGCLYGLHEDALGLQSVRRICEGLGT